MALRIARGRRITARTGPTRGSTKGAEARPVIERMFRRYGLPKAVLSDNGASFSSQALSGLSRLSVMVDQARDPADADRARTPGAERESRAYAPDPEGGDNPSALGPSADSTRFAASSMNSALTKLWGSAPRRRVTRLHRGLTRSGSPRWTTLGISRSDASAARARSSGKAGCCSSAMLSSASG